MAGNKKTRASCKKANALVHGIYYILNLKICQKFLFAFCHEFYINFICILYIFPASVSAIAWLIYQKFEGKLCP